MKHFTILLCLIFLCNIGMSQKRRVNSQGDYSGVIRVKFNSSKIQHLDAFSRSSENVNEAKASTSVGYVQTKMKAVDAINERFKVQKMKRVFRNAGKNEAKHRAHGLHLWYELEFSSKADVYRVIESYKNLAEISIAQAIPEAKLINNSIKYLDKTSNTEEVPIIDTSVIVNPTSLPNGTNDPLFPNQWHYNNTGQNGGTAGADISLLEAWKLETGNSNVVVAIEDGGVDWDHEDLAGNMWINAGEIANNGIDDDNNGFIDDVYGYNFVDNTGAISVGDHGTHVAGTVAAETNNGIGVAGVAGGSGSNDGVRVMSCNVFTDTSSGGFAEAYVYAADNGAVISQNSWGYTSVGVVDQAVLDAIDYFIANAGGADEAMNGGLVVFAAGNSKSSGLWYPGCYDKVLAVGSTNCKDEKAWYSNYDTWVDIAAPGGELVSTNNDPTAIHSTLPNNKYGVMQGTSMACPHVSGVAALIVSQNYGAITPQEVWNKIVDNADDIDASLGDYVGKMGSGRMNAFNALSTGVAPTIPTGLTANHIAATSFVLNWDLLPVAKSYEIRVRKTDELWSDTIIITNSYKHINASPETLYEYQLRAVNAIGKSNYTAIQTVTTLEMPTKAPETPTGFIASNITETSFLLNWDVVTIADEYQLRIREQGGTWIFYNTYDNFFDFADLTSNTVYEYQICALNAVGSSNFSDLATITTNGLPVSYCESKGENSSAEWIAKFTLGDFTNVSQADGYADFTSKIIEVNAGEDYSINLTPSFSGSGYNEYWKIWIDYNKDGVFTDADELAFDAGSLSKTTVNGIINIPSSATGETRIRVSMKYNSAQTACESFNYGEVEDYTLNIQGASQEVPQVPTGLMAINVGVNQFTLTWNTLSDAESYKIRIREQAGNWVYFTTTETSYLYANASEQTIYEFQVSAVNSVGDSDYCELENIETKAANISYCSSKGNSANYEWIDLVQLGNINNQSASDGGYADYTSMSANLAQGSSQTILIRAGYASSSYTEFWQVWIDFDRNGIFDINEKVVSGSSSKSAALNANITVPSDALLGDTRMRISMKYNSSADACENFSYGEVEDYTVTITNSQALASNSFRSDAITLGNEKPQELLIISPNPAHDIVVFTTSIDQGILAITNLTGQIVKTINFTSNRTEVNISELPTGMYLVKLIGQRDSTVKKLMKQ